MAPPAPTPPPPGTPPCGATTRAGATCKKPAGYKTGHEGAGNCAFHGGATPNGTKHGQRILANRAVVTFGLPVTIDPATALLEEIARTNGHVLWLEEQIRLLQPEELTWGLKSDADRVGFEANTTTTHAAGAHALVELCQRERTHLVKVCAAAIGAGVALRQVELAEQQGALAAEVVRTILSGLNLSEEQCGLVPGLIRRHLAAVPSVAG